MNLEWNFSNNISIIFNLLYYNIKIGWSKQVHKIIVHELKSSKIHEKTSRWDVKFRIIFVYYKEIIGLYKKMYD